MLKKIEIEYKNYYNSLIISRQKPLRNTEVGFWGQLPVETYYNFFKDYKLERKKSIVDLGSGDGKVVLLASLFTKSTGIEYDKELFNKSIEIRNRLGISCNLINDDYNNIDLSKFDLIIINPDKNFKFIERKIISEIHGKLIVCNNIFLPRFLKKGKTYWSNQVPFIEYSKV